MAAAWPSGVYIFGSNVVQFYNPLTQPHSQVGLNISLRGDSYKVIQKLVAKIKCAPLIALSMHNVYYACVPGLSGKIQVPDAVTTSLV